MNQTVLKQYVDAHFSERPSADFGWKYQVRDMLDEWAAVLAVGAVLGLLYYFGGEHLWIRVLSIVGLVCTSLGAIYLLGIVFLRRAFTRYKLTPDHFVYEHGFFRRKTETFQLSDIIQMSLRRSLWERVICTGTVKIRFKNSAGMKDNLLVIRGIGKYNEMFDRIDYYRNHHRLVLYFGI